MSQRQPANYSSAAVGLTVFASVMMMMIGAFQFVVGIVAVVNDEFFVVGQEWVFKFDATTWGWIHLLLGIVIFIAGMGLFAGQVWARTVGVLLALGSALAAFAWMPYYPLWGITIVALDVFVVWALTAHGRDIASA
jgi:hypothetical protein